MPLHAHDELVRRALDGLDDAVFVPSLITPGDAAFDLVPGSFPIQNQVLNDFGLPYTITTGPGPGVAPAGGIEAIEPAAGGEGQEGTPGDACLANFWTCEVVQ